MTDYYELHHKAVSLGWIPTPIEYAEGARNLTDTCWDFRDSNGDEIFDQDADYCCSSMNELLEDYENLINGAYKKLLLRKEITRVLASVRYAEQLAESLSRKDLADTLYAIGVSLGGKVKDL